MPVAGLSHVAGYIPAERPSLSELREALEISDAELRVLIQSHGLCRIAVENKLRVHEMIGVAVDLLFEGRAELAGEIGLILCTSTFPAFVPYLFDPFAGMQRKWGMERAEVRFVSQLNCASLDFLFRLARLWTERRGSGVLVLAADKMGLPRSRYLQDSTVSADAAAAAVVTKTAACNRIVGSAVQSNASVYNSMQASPEEYAWFQNTFTVGLVKVLRDVLQQAGVTAERLRYVFPANVNRGTWQRVADASGIPFERFYFPTMAEIGHAHNADPLLNAEHALRHALLQPGDLFATLTVGMGSTFGCTLFRH